MTVLALLALVAEIVVGSHVTLPLTPINENLIVVPMLEIAVCSAVIGWVLWLSR